MHARPARQGPALRRGRLSDRRRPLVSAVCAAGALLGVTGCVVLQAEPTGVQTGVVGPVQITFTACASQTGGSPPSGSCPRTGNSAQTAGTAPSQVFAGFRVPEDAVAPASFVSRSTGPANSGPQLTFTQSSAYAAELQRLDPAPPGTMWVGYVSQYVSYNAASGEQNVTAAPSFGLPANTPGTPFAGPFTFRVVVGGRQYVGGGTTVPDPREPIDCGTSLTSGTGSGSFNQICVDDPTQAVVDGAPDSVATRDAAIAPSPLVSARSGTTATMPFTLNWAGGAMAGSTFTLSAVSSVAGATLSVTPSSITPSANSHNPVGVSVGIPPGTPPGTYTVSLAARLSDGESRMAIDRLTVVAAPPSPLPPVSPPASPPVVAPGPARACRVPRLRGATLRTAVAAARDAGCRLGVIVQRHSRVRRGRIIHQVPGAGRVLPFDSTIAVSESLGRSRQSGHKPRTHVRKGSSRG